MCSGMALPGWSAGQIQGRLSIETILLNLLACVLREYKLVDKLQIQIPLIAEQSEVLVLVTKAPRDQIIVPKRYPVLV